MTNICTLTPKAQKLSAMRVTHTGGRRDERPSLASISRVTGLRPSHISKILNGRGVRIDTAVAICKAIGITLDEFVTRYYSHLAA